VCWSHATERDGVSLGDFVWLNGSESDNEVGACANLEEVENFEQIGYLSTRKPSFPSKPNPTSNLSLDVPDSKIETGEWNPRKPRHLLDLLDFLTGFKAATACHY